jgi:hypothetical protein
VNAVAVGQCGFFPVSEQVVALVEGRSVGRAEVGDRQARIAYLQDGVLCGDAAIDRMDAEVDAGIDALLSVVPPDQGLVVEPDSAFGKDLGKLDGVGTAAGDDAFVVFAVGGDDGGPLDCHCSAGRLRRRRGRRYRRIVAA